MADITKPYHGQRWKVCLMHVFDELLKLDNPQVAKILKEHEITILVDNDGPKLGCSFHNETEQKDMFVGSLIDMFREKYPKPKEEITFNSPMYTVGFVTTPTSNTATNAEGQKS